MVSFPQKGQFSNAFLIMDGGVHVQKKILKCNFGKYCQKKLDHHKIVDQRVVIMPGLT